MLLIRIDDYPTGVRPILPDRIQRLGRILLQFEKQEIPYLLGVVPDLLTPEDFVFLRSLRFAVMAMHGCDHLYGRWKEGDLDNEFFGLNAREVDRKVSSSLAKISEWSPRIFIPPFNTVTNELLDSLHDKGFSTICTSEHTRLGNFSSGTKLREVKTPNPLYGRTAGLVRIVKNDLSLLHKEDLAIGLHVTWEDDDFLAGGSGLEEFLDLVRPHVKSWKDLNQPPPSAAELQNILPADPEKSGVSQESRVLVKGNGAFRILHITERLSKGGAGRALIANAKYSGRFGSFQHKAISLAPVVDGVDTEGLEVLQAPSFDRICDEIRQADIVQWHWWHEIPLMRQQMPKHYALIVCHTSGNRAPHQLTPFEIGFAGHIVAGCEYSLELPVFKGIPTNKLSMVITGADFDRVLPVTKVPHMGFNSGWIGTIDGNRYPSDFLEVHSGIKIPGLKVVMVGMGPMWLQVREQVRRLGMTDQIKLLGYRENLRQVFGRLDVYGLYLNPETTAAAELNLQEAMVSELATVLMPYGGPKYEIENGVTGIIATTTKEYQQAMEYLYWHPAERKRMGGNARKKALECFGAENAALQMNRIYESVCL